MKKIVCGLITVYMMMLCVSFMPTLNMFGCLEADPCCQMHNVTDNPAGKQQPNTPIQHACCSICCSSGFVIEALVALPAKPAENVVLSVGYVSPIYLSPAVNGDTPPPRLA